MAGERTPLRVIMVGYLALAWHHWIGSIPFPFGGGEAHWVMNHFGPLRFVDGLFLGGLYVLAGTSLALLLRTRRVARALLIGVVVPAIVVGTTGAVERRFADILTAVAIYALPLVVIGLVIVLSRVQLTPVTIGVLAWWPGFVHLLSYMLGASLPSAFLEGVELMWVAGGVLVGLVARVPARRVEP